MKMALPVVILVALTSVAHAEDSKSPWSGAVIDRNDGSVGSKSTILKKDVGDGWSVGGQLTTKYQDPKITPGASPPEPFNGGSPLNNAIIGPYFEKKF